MNKQEFLDELSRWIKDELMILRQLSILFLELKDILESDIRQKLDIYKINIEIEVNINEICRKNSEYNYLKKYIWDINVWNINFIIKQIKDLIKRLLLIIEKKKQDQNEDNVVELYLDRVKKLNFQILTEEDKYISEFQSKIYWKIVIFNDLLYYFMMLKEWEINSDFILRKIQVLILKIWKRKYYFFKYNDIDHKIKEIKLIITALQEVLILKIWVDQLID